MEPASRADQPAGEAGLDRRSSESPLDLELPDPIAKAAQRREAPVCPLGQARVPAVSQREDPLRCSLEQFKAPGDGSERAGELHPRRPGPDNPDPSALQR